MSRHGEINSLTSFLNKILFKLNFSKRKAKNINNENCVLNFDLSLHISQAAHCRKNVEIHKLNKKNGENFENVSTKTLFASILSLNCERKLVFSLA